ncbi:MAG: 3-dehydroquinate synthase family protein [Bacteroidales bacterium]|nr:3-dehydroquinate synthase family protein [Bacteroidales bacterium]
MKISSRIVTTTRTPTFFGNLALASVDRLVSTTRPDGIYILVDPNTRKHCLPLLLDKTATLINAQILEIEGGEASKSLENAEMIWKQLLILQASRSSLLINLGGGVVSDLGGFAAAGYKRGIRYLNIPTSLMGQADAAIGGKTAVNIGAIKNQVGFFHAPTAVIINPEFLKTLPLAHLRSGLAEIIKSILISNPSLWRRIYKKPVNLLLNMPADSKFWQELIKAAIIFKNKIVVKDYRELKTRKVLNFGHTLGHAIESWSMQGSEIPLLHGDAVAAGMICATYLSYLKTGLPKEDMEEITAYLLEGYGHIQVGTASKSIIMEFLKQDKKNAGGLIRFTLISKPGYPVINVVCDHAEISEALDNYSSLSRITA